MEPDNVVFSRDLVMTSTFPFGGDPTCNPESWINALRVIFQANFNTIILGHGPPCNNGTVKRLLDMFLVLRERIQIAIEKNWSSDEFIDNDGVPEYYNDGNEVQIKRTIDHWFEFYKSGVVDK